MSQANQTRAQLLPRQFPATPGQVLGPYFLDNSPRRQRLFPARAKGSRLTIKGQVLSVDGKPVSGATVHIWLADPNGRYDNQDDAGNPLVVPVDQQLYRGRVVTVGAGVYSFECLRPGNYFDDGWKLWRPAHIHVKVEAPGFKDLTTQLYFQDDAQNKHDIPGDDFFQPELAVQLFPAAPSAGSKQSGIFNFVLAAR
jgi:protocatechuate 3,4-dioxygenase beta subunit